MPAAPSAPAAVSALLLLVLAAAASLPPTLAAVPAPPASNDEGRILRLLRQQLCKAAPHRLMARMPGWQPGNATSHCHWMGVTCDDAGRVTHLNISIDTREDLLYKSPSRSNSSGSSSSSGGSGGSGGGTASGEEEAVPPAASVALPAELAQLQWLQEFDLNYLWEPLGLQAGIPEAWASTPGSFPRLQRLSLQLLTASSQLPLPEVCPGAFPRLAQLHLRFPLLRSALPGSWGGSPTVLPALEELDVAVQVVGQLPRSWARGFRRLRRLLVSDPMQSGGRGSRGPAEERALPSEWVVIEGAFPLLQSLSLSFLNLAGAFPPAWDQRGLPHLTELALDANSLTGPLPPRLFATHPKLSALKLTTNLFTGTLPPEWGKSQVEYLGLSRIPGLAGPAFPAAWTQPGSFSKLLVLQLDGNPRLTGTLPDYLAWPRVKTLILNHCHRLTGTIPATWCNASAAPQSLTMLGLRGTAVDARLPNCSGYAETDWIAQFLKSGQFVIVNEEPEVNFLPDPRVYQFFDRSLYKAPAPPGGPSLAQVLLPCAAAAGATAAVVGLLLRAKQPAAITRLLGPRHHPAGHGSGDTSGSRVLSLLVNSNASTAGDGSKGSSGGSNQARGVPAESRQAQLAAMLKAGLGGGSGGEEGVPLLLLQETELPAVLLHCISEGDQEAEAKVGHPMPKGESAPAGSLPPRQHHAHTAEWVAQYAAATGALSSSSPSSGTRGQPPVSSPGSSGSRALASLQQHAQDAWSLRVPPGSLALSRDRQGELVVLGQGSQAMVCLGRLQGVEVAVKVYELPGPLDLRAVWREASLLRRCVHDRIVPLYGVACQGQVLLLAMQLMRGGSLKAALGCPDTRRRLRWREGGRQVAVDVAEALAYLHSQHGLMHSDLKPSNVLLSADLRASLCDLGMAQVVGSQAASAAGLSCMYAAPEQLMGQRCTVAADIYSLGMLLTVVATQQVGERRFQWRLPRAPEECPEAALQLIQECVAADPTCRPTAAEALRRLRQPDAA